MENILFLRLRLLGDIIFTIPSLLLYRQKYPQHRIYYVVEEKFSEVADILPAVHETIIIPHKMGIRDLLNFRKRIRQLQINTVIDFHSGPKSALLSRLTGAKSRIGYKTPNRNWAYNHLIPRKTSLKPTHSVYNQARLLTQTGIAIDEIPPYPPLTIKKLQLDLHLPDSARKIAIHLGAKKKFRDWGLDNFTALIKRLIRDNHHIFLIGNSPEEQQRGAHLAQFTGVSNLTGKLGLRETLSVIADSNVYFGADSGPLHLASLSATPIVAMYGPNIPAISGPWRKERVIILQLDLDCIPCSQKKCKYDTIKCMKNIKVNDAYEAIQQFL